MTDSISATEEAAPSSNSSAASMRIAVLDRDSGFIQVLSKRLDRLGWEYRVLAGPVPTEAIASMRLSALVIDLAVLGPQAWEWLERLSGDLPELGVVVCTGPSTVAQRVRGLRLGADDWITKPCHPEEVIARVQGVARRRRRSTGRAEVKPLLAGEVEIRTDRFQAFVAGQSLDLTRREFELIELLAAAEGRVLEREEIYSRLWGYAMVRGDRSVNVFVRKLRQKLERASPRWRYIHTHFGIGYRFAAESLDAIAVRASSGADIAVDVAPASSAPVELECRRSEQARGGAAGPCSSPPEPSRRTTARLPFFRSIRPPVSPATSRERSGSWPTSSRRPSGAGTPASSSSTCGMSNPPARGWCSRKSARWDSLQPSAASAAVARARTLGLNRTSSNATAKRSIAMPAARACCSPRPVNRRCESTRVPCGSASA